MSTFWLGDTKWSDYDLKKSPVFVLIWASMTHFWALLLHPWLERIQDKLVIDVASGQYDNAAELRYIRK